MITRRPLIRKAALSFIFLSIIFLTSCATQRGIKRGELPPPAPPAPQEEKSSTIDEQKEIVKGVFHIVRKGENLYRISKIYGMDMQKLAALNEISDPSKISVGQPIFIPGVSRQLPVPVIKGERTDALQGEEFAWPVFGTLTSRFGEKRHGHYHSGIDIRAPDGTDVVAARDGIVTFSGIEHSYGRMVIINHGDGSSTVYAHNSINLVDTGKRVSRGDIVARVGSSGNASGSHIHFEIRIDNISIDPLICLSEASKVHL